MSSEIVKFTVPLTPPSTNHYTNVCVYRGRDGHARRGRKLSEEAKAFNWAVAVMARGATVVPATEAERRKARYRVEIRLYLGKNQRLDADNAFKVGVDSLVKAGVIHADHRCEVYAPVPERDWANPRTEFTVQRLEP